jgi:hypothetical protein
MIKEPGSFDSMDADLNKWKAGGKLHRKLVDWWEGHLHRERNMQIHSRHHPLTHTKE